jgi:hypothetical protein
MVGPDFRNRRSSSPFAEIDRDVEVLEHIFKTRH